jgi:histidinol-phosphatase
VTGADDLQLAFDTSDLAANLALTYFESGVSVTLKDDGTPVTEADRAVERLIRETLSAARPADALLGEELGHLGESDRVWIIDPIDGTSFFSRRDPNWRVQLALEVAGSTELAVVIAPALQLCWWATRGGGAFESSWHPGDGHVGAAESSKEAESRAQPAPDAPTPKRLEASAGSPKSLEVSAGSPKRLEVSAGSPKRLEVSAGSPKRLEVSTTSALADARLSALDDASRARLPPSATRPPASPLPLVELVRGEIEAFLVERYYIWDHAPWILLVEEAGGRFTDRTGGHQGNQGGGLYSNAALHSQLLSALHYPTHPSPR